MSLSVHLINAAAIPLAVVRRRAGPSELSTVVPQSCGLVWDFIRAHQLKAGRHVALYLNGDIDLEVGVEIESDFLEQGGIVRSQTPEGLIAWVVHFGPYQRLGAAHDAIKAWCATEGHRLTGVRWEIYGHWQPSWNTDPSAIRTDVFYQLASA